VCGVPEPRRVLAGLLLAAAALGFSANGAQASDGCDKVASPGGSGTVQKLVDSLSAGQTGCLRAGTYSGDVDIRAGGISLRGYPGEKAKVVGEFEVHKAAPHVTVERLYLDGSTASRTSPIINASDATFRYDDVTNRHQGICFVLGDANGVWGRADRAVIERNRIHDCGRLPATNYDHGIYVDGATGVLIQGNWIYRNSDFGVHLYPDAQRTVVRGNVIDGNGMGATFSGNSDQASSNNKLEGNVIANSKVRWNIESWFGSHAGSGNVARANCLHATNHRSYYNSHGGVTTEGGGFTVASNSVADPHYLNRSADDFRLAADSRCRDTFAGDPDAVPGPDGELPAHRPSARRTRTVRLSARRYVRRGRRARLRGRIARALVRPGRRVLIYARANGRRRLVARVRVSRTGRFAARPRVRIAERTVWFRAVVPRVGRSRVVQVRVRG
jgi:parallel beta-helix repeat protein